MLVRELDCGCVVGHRAPLGPNPPPHIITFCWSSDGDGRLIWDFNRFCKIADQMVERDDHDNLMAHVGIGMAATEAEA